MPDVPAPSSRTESVEALFAEYVADRDAGRLIDVEALCARAGAEAPELRSRLRAYAVLLDLGSALRGDDDPEPARDPLPRSGARLGRYENLRLLGEGGLSRVYVARDPELERDVALKVIATEHVSIDSARAWIRQEGRTLARLEHAGVVQVFDMGEVDGLTYVAMELVDGPSLADVLDELRARRDGTVLRSDDPRVPRAADQLAGIGARATLALGIGRALAACHAGGVLHRDVKPGNVLLEQGTSPKLIDFGLAHLEESGGSLNRVTQRLIGTPAYISPEQVESGQTGADPRSDQFSFGVLLYELLTLTTPFQRGTRTQTLDAVARALPPQPKQLDAAIPADLETICLHALERDPRERYPSMEALADDLAAFLDHRAIAVSPPSLGRRLRLWSRRNRRDILFLGVPAAALLVGIAAFQAVGVHTARSEYFADADRLREEIRSYADPLLLRTAFERARDLDWRAHDLDSGLVLRHFLESATPVSRGLLLEISEVVRTELARARARITDEPALRAEAEEELLRDWEAVLVVEATVCPECPANALDRNRGIIDLPEPPLGTRLEIGRLPPGGQPFSFAYVPVSNVRSLTRGEFRVTWLDENSDCLGEFDLLVQRRTQRTTLVLRPIAPDVRARLVHVPAGRWCVEPSESHEVPEFWAYAGWFTANDVAARFVEQALTVDETLEGLPILQPSGPAPGHAAYTARGFSARLPSPLQALRLLELTRAGDSRFDPLPQGYAGEYCSGPLNALGRMHLSHAWSTAKPVTLRAVLDGGYSAAGPFAFRVVVSRPPKN